MQMNRKHQWVAMLALLLSAAVSGGSVAASPSGEPDPGLVEALRAGGYVIYVRHAPTHWEQDDLVESLDDVSSCDGERMRQLTPQGRETSRRIGNAIRTLRIPIGQVLASEYCRTVETATLMQLGEVVTTRDVINARAARLLQGREHLAETARARLSTPPVPGTNTVIVAHGNVFVLAAGTRPPEAGAAVVRPDGASGFEIVAMLDAEDWSCLLAAEQASIPLPAHAD